MQLPRIPPISRWMQRAHVEALVLGLAAACFLVVCGSSAYEHVVVVPRWTSDPPASLAIFHGPYALTPERWWTLAHLPALALVIAAAALLRDQVRGRWVAIAGGVYAAVLVVTVVWFVPELTQLTANLDAGIPAAEWKARADHWERLSLIRLAVMLGVGGVLIRAIAMPATMRQERAPRTAATAGGGATAGPPGRP